MSTLDGFPIAVGASVYDMAYGTGVVTSVNALQNNMQVTFAAAQRNGVYTTDNGAATGGVGTRFAARTMYWQFPIVVPPPPVVLATPNSPNWTQISKVMAAVYLAFR